MAKHIAVKGVVQGVGFRPFIYELATRYHLHGWICKTSGGVEISVDGQSDDVEQFIRSISTEKPLPAKIDSLRVTEAPALTATRFEIREALEEESRYQPLAADIAICPGCERELFDPSDRRYLYPFINCAQCGPRFTIIKDIPYGRSNTTMGKFPICERCHMEYTNPQDRRFHAQSMACPDCGPFVELRETHSQFPTTDPRISSIEIRTSAILKARRLLREGYIVAIKGLGGFHLACDASNPYTVAELRERKGHADKPFTVMAGNLPAVFSICELGQEEQRLLTGHQRPIVLLAREKSSDPRTTRVSELVTPSLDTLGVMLPYTPLHHLLLNQTDPILAREPVPSILVMTSSNFNEEPSATDNADALKRLSPLADAFLLHNRDIHIRADDSVVRVHQSKTFYLRRARGYAPYTITLPFDARPTLAVGSELKNTFCLARAREAILSHHIGDMRNPETHASFEQGIRHLSHIFRVEPEIIAHDLHPDYFTTQFAHRLEAQCIGIQHHHAHIVSCMLDNDLSDRKVIGLSFDGNGHGTDGMLWGGEALLASFAEFDRFAHLEYLPLPGGDTAILHPWQIALGYAHALGLNVERLPSFQHVDKQAWGVLRRQMDRRTNAPQTSSMGCLFDAVASLIGVRNECTYEAQAVMEMEVLSKPFLSTARTYPYAIEGTQEGKVIRLGAMLQSILDAIRASEPIGQIGMNFHKTIADISLAICRQARGTTALNDVALSGSLWQNQILLGFVRSGLQRDGFVVYSHRQVPTNDGGLSLGQAVIANHICAERSKRTGKHSRSGS